MTQIFFYHNAKDRLLAAANLIKKAFRQKKVLSVYAPDPEIADRLDRHLWMYPPTGFIPHVKAPSPLASETPILIASDPEQLSWHERLLNLSAEIPSGFSRFSSVIEIVSGDEEERIAGRSRAKYYKDRGYEIRFFDLSEED